MTGITIAVDDYGPIMFYDIGRPSSVTAKGTDGSLYIVRLVRDAAKNVQRRNVPRADDRERQDE